MLLYRAFHAQRSCLRPHVARLGLGAGQPKLLWYLAGHGPCRQRELAEYFEIDPAAVCRMLDSLEKGGFVARSAQQGDRRADVVRLTEKGGAASGRCFRALRAGRRSSFRNIWPAHTATCAERVCEGGCA